MNDELVIDQVETFTGRAVPLLIEYHQKLNGAFERLRSLGDRTSYDRCYYYGRENAVRVEAAALDEWYRRFEPAARRFAQEVSGMVDQGRLSSLERAELQLRLAEFEAALVMFPELLTVYRRT